MQTSTPVCVSAPIDCAPEGLSARDLEDEITTLGPSIPMATWRLLMLIAELDRRGTWQQHGVLSCAHWLNRKCGIDIRAAREKVRVARAVECLPLVSDALARLGTASHVEKLVRAYRHVELRTLCVVCLHVLWLPGRDEMCRRIKHNSTIVGNV